MSWIREEDVNLPEVIKVMSIQPKAMEAVQQLNMAVTFGGSVLTRVRKRPSRRWCRQPTTAGIEPWRTGGSSVTIRTTRSWPAT